MATPEPTLSRVEIEIADGVVAGWRSRREGAPRLLFSHATGFCASAYKQMLTPLAPSFDVLAVDLRGHGRTRLPAEPRRLRSWDIFAEDLRGILDRLGGEDWVLAGHSCGATVSALAAQGRTDVAALALIEPAVMPGLYHFAAASPFWRVFADELPLVKGARARRDGGDSRETVRASYARKKLFAAWAPGALDDYLEDGLVERAGGGVRLACAPAWEAATFAAQGHDPWGALVTNAARLSVLAADDPSTTLGAAARRRLARAGARVERAEGATHLLPLEAPSRAAEFIEAAALRAGPRPQRL